MKTGVLISVALILSNHVSAQDLGEFPHDPTERGADKLRVCFYNVENLFDTSDDPASDDDAYLPEGVNQWTYGKYRRKLNNIAKTIVALGGWELPALVGVAEAENWQVLHDLCSATPMSKGGYRVIHENSPDRRGIDVGILYRPEKLTALQHRAIAVQGAADAAFTRDILHATFRLHQNDTIHVFVNHWPSRYRGAAATAPLRIGAAKRLRMAVDSLFGRDPTAYIVIMGDFNDRPADQSLAGILEARPVERAAHPGLINLMYGLEGGTIYHTEVTGQWFFYDQIIVSTELLSSTGWQTVYDKAFVFEAEWLLEEGSGRPFRSFKGPVFTGGYSDHLPVYIDLRRNP